MNSDYKNLLMDTPFVNLNKFWYLTNTSALILENKLKLKSKGKISGISQELLLLENKHRFYISATITPKTFIKKALIGLKIRNQLFVKEYSGLLVNQEYLISTVVDYNKSMLEENPEFHIIIESSIDKCEVEIKEPLVVSLTQLEATTKLKDELDTLLKYKNGFTYKNELITSNLTATLFENKYWKVEKNSIDTLEWDGQRGIVATVKNKIKIYQEVILKEGNIYLLKLNMFRYLGEGNIIVKFNKKTLKVNLREYNFQEFMLVEAQRENLRSIEFETTNNKVPLIFYVKNILLVNLTRSNMLNIEEQDIYRLPYIIS